MTDPRIYTNPIPLIRYKGKNGSYLYSEKECLSLLEIFIDRAKKVWKEEQGKKGKPETAARRELPAYKPGGRGRLFWLDSE
jgi:hypothetical protein